MALNAASHNATGEKTGPVSGQPPAPFSDTLQAIQQAKRDDPIGQHAGGQDGGDKAAPQKVKTEKELEKERKKAEKEAKFLAKKAALEEKKKTGEQAGPSKTQQKKKDVKPKEEALPPYVEETPVGQKKILRSLDDPYYKTYNPRAVESGWYDWWEKEGFFLPQYGEDGNVKPAGYFSMCFPPPNITGSLHMGHALTVALQDTMIRFERMRGKTVVFLPGYDHAGIATQSVVEKQLARREKKTRHDLGRAKFLDLVQDWKEEYHQKISATLKRSGGSFDWSRESFTMDDRGKRAVKETFCKLHEEGLIYRANKLVNWCCKLNTALSNLEVENKEITGRTLLDVPGYEKKIEFGVLTHFKYQIEGTDEFIEVATTRPETMLGDTAIAVHPKDERYKHLLGKKAKHPFVDRGMPIVADDYVEMEFGTGAVKITPAHDPNDYAIGQRHNLEFVNILNDDGTLNSNCGKEFEGMKRFDARYKVTSRLEELGLFVKKEDNAMKVPFCERSKDVIEPLIKPQWWMKMQDLATPALDAVKNGDIKIRPESAEKMYCRWLENLNDWCLSRQLWWGHQIPAYFVHVEGETSDKNDDNRWVTGRSEEQALENAQKLFPGKKVTLEQDEDVLDTWFSSGQWPYVTLGWPDKTKDFEKLYPQSVLETGWDIIFFWVARMIMFGIRITGKVPFKEVYCHSLVRDKDGRKMSKSLGNVIDPIDVLEGIELEDLHKKLLAGNLDPKEVEQAQQWQKKAFKDGIPECGMDALRFALVNYSTGGGDLNFEIKVIHGYRRFCNKIWQATKFVLGNLDKNFTPAKTEGKTGRESLAERWILSKMTRAAKQATEKLESRDFSESSQATYQFLYSQLFDVYIENSKGIINGGTPEEQESAKQTLYTALESGLRMVHPFMPFLTEELWQRLPRRPDDKTKSIMIASYPVHDASLDDPAAEQAYELVMDVAQTVRRLTAEYSIKENGKLYVQSFDDTAYKTTKDELAAIKALSGKGVETIELVAPGQEKPQGCVPGTVNASATVHLLVKGHVDLNSEIEKATKKLERANEQVKKSKKIMSVEGYTEKVAKEVRDGEKQKLADAEAEVKSMTGAIEAFEVMKLE